MYSPVQLSARLARKLCLGHKKKYLTFFLIIFLSGGGGQQATLRHCIRVTHPNCDTNTFKTLDKIYKDHEKEKKDLYEEREYFSQRKDPLSL